MPKDAIDISGQRFGRLIAIEYAGNFGKYNRGYWRCKCDCGKEVIVNKSSLMNGSTKSCGCLRSDKARDRAINGIKRGDKYYNIKNFSSREKRIYRIWKGMKERCSNPNCKEAKYYFHKGIRVCEEWSNNFILFRNWALSNGYDDNLTIDRIDSSFGYSPDNCRWETMISQNNNTAKNRFITIDGLTLTIAQWTRKMGLPRGTISSRISRGWGEERAIKTPVISKNNERT